MIYISNDGSNSVFIFFRFLVFTEALTQNLNLRLSLDLINFTTAISIHYDTSLGKSLVLFEIISTAIKMCYNLTLPSVLVVYVLLSDLYSPILVRSQS